MLAVPTLVFMRHGLTDWNVEGRLQGQQDVSVNAVGRAQARRNGEAILAAVPEAVTFDFVASPLRRARQTMAIVRAAMGLAPQAYRIDERLRELTFGEWESYTLDEIRARQPAALAAREADKWGFQPPGGESYERFSKRIRAWLAGLRRPSVVVAHGGVGRVLTIELAGVDPLTAVSSDVPHDRVFVWREGVATPL